MVAEDHTLGSACCPAGVIHLIAISIRKHVVVLLSQCWVAGLEDCVEVDAGAQEVCVDVSFCMRVDENHLLDAALLVAAGYDSFLRHGVNCAGQDLQPIRVNECQQG